MVQEAADKGNIHANYDLGKYLWHSKQFAEARRRFLEVTRELSNLPPTAATEKLRKKIEDFEREYTNKEGSDVDVNGDEAVNQDGLSLKNGSQKLQNDRALLLEVVKQNGLSLKYASSELRNDSKPILEVVK